MNEIKPHLIANSDTKIRSRPLIDRRFDSAVNIGQLVTNFLMVLVTSWFSYISIDVYNKNNDLHKQSRRLQIQPILEFVEAQPNSDKTWISLRIKNIGAGPALDIRLIIHQDTILSDIAYFCFPLGVNKDTALLRKRRASDAVQRIGDYDVQDHIDSREEVIFEFMQNPTSEAFGVFGSKYSFFFSYFDSDGNEYLRIFNESSSSPVFPIIIIPKKGFFQDSLRDLARNIPQGGAGTLENISIRGPHGWFQDIDSLYLEESNMESLKDSAKQF
ncbi:MAG: hypothetical protein SGI97_01695 [candidate division Zixibacteria bacterium]|nr:hypothetical protein [candidate division Zixibacteria bacterium]